MAAAAGVSQSTVSRALRGDPKISPATRDRIMAVVDQLGYRVNTAARSLITSRTQTMGVAVADITNPFYPFLLDALYREFRELGYSTLLFAEVTDGDEARADPLSPLLVQSVDGLVAASATLGSDLGDAAKRQHVPVVFLLRHVGDERHDRVVSDNVGGGRAVARLLHDLGHTKIAMISGPSNTSTAIERDQGFLEELERLGLPPDAVGCRRGPYAHRTGYDEMLALLREDDPPTAVFCGNDVIAFGALDAAETLGCSVPRDLSIVGFNDIPIAGWRRVNLTTVRQPLRDMARAAVRMLVERVEAPDLEPRCQVFPVELVYRGTTGPPPG